jgi:hypothetical protein
MIELTQSAMEELASLMDDYRDLDPQFDAIIELLDNARTSDRPCTLAIGD